MSYFNNPWRALACAAKLRDWGQIDAILADKALCGNDAVRRGFTDARRKLGQEPLLPALSAPEPITIHDLPSLDGIEIVGTGEGQLRKWRTKKAA